MVSFNNAGRMGNWMFEAFTAAAYALKYNMDFTVPTQTNNPIHNPVYCLHLVNPNYNPNLEEVRLWENGHAYQELPFEESYRNKNVIVEGYRQSEKYFKDYRNELLYIFNFPYEEKDGYVSVHVRRGDYLHLRMKHPEVTKEWYENAMDLFRGYKFKFFSDEIGWCRQEFGNRLDCEFSTNSNEYDDLVEMSCCEHQINSSSTFSWWGAWLNQNPDKVIYTPKDWFVPGWMNMDVSDIIPETWIKL